jgi:hypothetical protein
MTCQGCFAASLLSWPLIVGSLWLLLCYRLPASLYMLPGYRLGFEILGYDLGLPVRVLGLGLPVRVSHGAGTT